MDKILLFAGIIFIAFISCEEIEEDERVFVDNCPLVNDSTFFVERIYSSRTHKVSNSELKTINNLFARNDLTLNNLRVYKLQTGLGFNLVRCDQFYGGLLLITEPVAFQFNNGGYLNYISGDIIDSINIDTIPNISAESTGVILYKCITSDLNAPRVLMQKSTCFEAELGIFDINAGVGYTDKNFVLVWKVEPRNAESPQVIINAKTDSLIRYYNGIYF
ncbi:MAG: hypothetical protein KAT38_05610 [Bacteroidales bacterium]|nr:hypothetical protein [Bacteroidales bacterium]